jgi:hypothetical protein
LVHNKPKRTPPRKHNPRTRTTHTAQHTTTPTAWERRTEQVVDACAVVTNDVPRRNRGPLQAQTAPRAPPPRDRHPLAAHPTVEPSEQQQNTPSRHQGKPLVLATLRGGLATSTASLSSAKDRYLRPQREYLLRPTFTKVTTSQARRLKTSSTRGPSAPPRQHEPRAQPAAPGKPLTGRDSNYDTSREGMTPRRRRRTSKEGQGLHLRAPRGGQQDASP